MFLAYSSLGKQKSRGLNKIVHTIIDQTCLVLCCRRGGFIYVELNCDKDDESNLHFMKCSKKKRGYYNTTITSFNMKFYSKYINYAIR
uniref:Uncharacterized protein n=1 Tax=Solanum lycopersicum TaxID=4081 RepID=A0A3Q7H0T4_SOLLC